jgi:hypothetical protein
MLLHSWNLQGPLSMIHVPFTDDGANGPMVVTSVWL